MLPPDPELILLLGRVAHQDQAAFHELYEKTSARLYGICLKLLRQRDLAEEALQEGFVSIWHHADEYHEARGSPFNWMAVIARYRALDILRRRRQQADNSEELLAAMADERPDPQELSFTSEAIKALQGCIDELSEPQRNSILLAYYRGFSHDELALALSMPLGTIKSWIRRGLISLKRCLER